MSVGGVEKENTANSCFVDSFNDGIFFYFSLLSAFMKSYIFLLNSP